ncbi:MAG TPA: alpha/beta fold hydrolase [Vicinamibacterales bacterium]|nr:alpha/beta fold hydrolase [Vicinamibacterales bacterium]
MTLEQFIADLDGLVDVVRRRFDKDKVVIYGHSWGSALGVCYAARFPETAKYSAALEKFPALDARGVTH